MSSEDTSPDHFSSINAQLDAAERYLHEGNIDVSLSLQLKLQYLSYVA